MLALNNVEVMYDKVILVLKGLSLEVPDGRIVALLGANGAGKSTTLKAISGLLRTEEGEVTEGSVELDGVRLDRLDPSEIVRRGVFHVLEGRRVFEHLTVEENLLAGAHTRRDGGINGDLAAVYGYFAARRAAKRDRRLPLRWRAADARYRPRAHGPPAAHAPRRALARALADAR